MKIRIKGNSVRLRLTQSEVEQFDNEGQVEEAIDFGFDNQLTYQLIKKEVDSIAANYQNNTIQIIIPNAIAHNWANTDAVSLEHFSDLKQDKQLRILVEKDFKCLTVRAHEDESDAFPHPEPQLNC